MSDSTEQIRPVVGFGGRYSVTSSGRVISHVATNTKDGHRLGAGTPGKYCRVMLRKNGKTWPMMAHRVVCETFNGPPPTPDHCVNHKNGLKHDNRAENLEWVTHLENCRHAVETGLIKPRKWSLEVRAEVKRRRAAGESQYSIANSLGMSSGYVCQVCTDWHQRRHRKDRQSRDDFKRKMKTYAAGRWLTMADLERHAALHYNFKPAPLAAWLNAKPSRWRKFRCVADAVKGMRAPTFRRGTRWYLPGVAA